MVDLGNRAQKVRVFVHLAREFGRAAWKQRWDQGKIVGINHEDPYGYRQAEEMGCLVDQSEDYPENRIKRLLRLAMRAVLGFDFLHAWDNRRGIFNAEVIWTHTESQALSVLLLGRLYPKAASSTLVIAQTVWVMDNWESFSWLRRAFYTRLLGRADMLTFLSPSAAAKARQLFPHSRVEFVKYGIRADQSLAVIEREPHAQVRVLTMGNDRHRDWSTFISAIRNDARYQAKALTGAKIDRLLAQATNITREKAKTNSELMSVLRWADVVVVCLVDNLHASGITVIEEAVLCGIPVICSDVGGLRSYFGPDEVTYVPPGNPDALRVAIEYLAGDEKLRQGKASKALARMRDGDLNSRGFVAKHVELSDELLRARRSEEPSKVLTAAAK